MSEKVKRLPKLNIPALAGMWYTLSSVLERGSAIIFTPIYTRLLLPEAYGVYSVYTSFLSIVTVFATLEISGGAVYRGLEQFKDKSQFISSAFGLITLSSLVSLLIYLIFSERINEISGLRPYLMIILFLQAFLNGIRSLKVSEAKFTYNKKLPLIEALFFSVIIPLSAIILIIFSKEVENARIYASLIASVIFAVPLIFSILKNGKFRVYKRDEWNFLIKYTIPALPHYIFISLIWQIGKIIVGNRFSAAQAGLLALATSVGLLPTLLTLGIQSALLPWITRKLSEARSGREKIYSLISSIFFPLCLAVCMFLIICPEVFRIMSGKNYSDALGAVYPIAASVPAFFLTNLLCAEITYYKKTHLVTIGSGVAAVFVLICNLLFTFRLGFEFSACLIPLAFLFMTIIYCVILKKKFIHRELPLKKLLFTYFLFCFMVILIAFLRISFIARIPLGIAIIMLLLPRIKKLKPLYSE